ncbi:hypothetical protein VIOR3934_03889 [Vibrio orientalis CIP 102891 = ATCC 33934]|uniref:Uncharacterized protein n=1 Tax=Vibrio orientalis CIP 102891 = ATCC 33934 TaxID=675816 RepID=C9QHS3_VIBOR|nr:hypothetical protein [Vibrio orientalis]EEX92244.1 hypothetical protein VIA_002888 [Vibrio orientalis CIP 102891 = ATCC 33934]EGU53245.1 hypothetical protein VIOR3934_03889 [Vibrio orientalis CIP 102891 = ATCC 33934]
MEFEIYMPCEPAWICDSFLALFSVLLVMGLVAFIYILYKEYRRIHRVKKRKARRDASRKGKP